MIRGAIFDMDGVLLDNLRHHLQAWRQLGEELGKPLSDEEIRATFGQRNQEMLKALIGRKFSRQETKRLSDRKETIYREIMKQDLERAAVPGLSDFVQELKREGVRLAVATSGPWDNVRMVLSGLNLGAFFDAVVTGADVTRGKPDPEVFLLAAERLDLRPEECVVFEDSPSGVEAGVRAGCICAALATSHSKTELEPLGPHLIVADFTQLSASRLRQLDD